ncbi:MAG: YdhR family protein [Chloroflexi bacterium]|nr:YdhR family protein [Chloroflexota bacterium]
MISQVITFTLKGMSEAEYLKVCDDLAPAVANQPGLLYKVFIADRATNTYGGIYAWRDKASMEAFAKTDLVKAVASHPNITNFAARDFAVIEGPTRVCHGLVEAAVASRR